MYCPNCGKQLPDKTAVCPYCGKPTGEKETAPAPVKVSPTPTKPAKQVKQEKQNKESNTSRGMGIAGFVLSLIAVVGTLSAILSLVVNIMEGSNIYFASGIFLLPIVGFVFSMVGWYSGKTDDNADTYKNTYALVGNALGAIAIVFATAYCIFALLAA